MSIILICPKCHNQVFDDSYDPDEKTYRCILCPTFEIEGRHIKPDELLALDTRDIVRHN